MAEQSNSAAASVHWSGLMQETSSSGSDEALVAAARAGDRAAFGELYTRYSRMVHGILLCNIPRHAVEDLVHDVFLRALRRLETLRDTARFGSWLASIARNCATDYYRRSSFADEVSEAQLADSAAGPGKQASLEVEAAVILAHIQCLPPAYRETLVLRLVEGMTGPEIAARTGLSHGSVRVNLYRGMQQLRQRLSGRKREMETKHEE
jgi:RNA polymerase sigma-70 factor (ECF subfamily)